MDFLKELLGRCVGKTAPVHKKNLKRQVFQILWIK